jgi:hypothetical protein
MIKENDAMTAPKSMDPAQFLRERAASADPDVLRAMVKTFADALMSAEADALCGASYGQRSDERTNHRNGYRPREWDTRAGTVELAIPKLRQGSYFPDWLLQHRRRAEQALVSVVATSYLLGVSTRRVEKLVEQLGVAQLSKSRVSEMATYLDAQVEAFRNRPLDSGPYTFVWLDALTIKVRESGRTVNVHALVAVGVNADGQRESPRAGGRLPGGRRRLAGVPAVADCPGPGRSTAGHLRRPPRPGRRRRGRAAGRFLAAVPHALLAEPVDQGAQVGAAVGGHHGADHLRPARRGIRAGISTAALWKPSRPDSLMQQRIWTKRGRTCWRSRCSHTRSGARSGATTRKSA